MKQQQLNKQKNIYKTINLILTCCLVILLAGGFFSFNGCAKKKATGNVITLPVTRGTFIHEIVGKGSAESSKNVDIINQVEGSSTIVELIPEGETVEEGAVLVRLDTESIDDKVNTQEISYNSSVAQVASAQATLRTAELSLEEYIEGTFEQSWATIENDIYSNQETQKQSADSVRYSERLVQLGYSTTAQLEVDRVSEQKARNNVRSSLLEQMVLLKYTSEKQITDLMSSIETARANLESESYTNKLNKDRLDHYKEQQRLCTMVAPQAGQVVYSNQESRPGRQESEIIKEGATVRKGQVMIRLPDPNQMQIKGMINESNISYVDVGMKAYLTFDALSSQRFEGEVVKVNRYPEIVWMSSTKDYITIIKIKEGSEKVRTGLTAEVRIIAKEIPNVLMIPVHAVLEYGSKAYCLTYNDKNWGFKEVLLGPSNDKNIIIKAGLEEGEQIVAGARNYKKMVQFPEISEPSIYADQIAAEAAKAGKNSDSATAGADKKGQGNNPDAGIAASDSNKKPASGNPLEALKNKEGKIDLSSLPESLPVFVREIAKKADTDSDGFLDSKELENLSKKMPAPGNGPMAGGAPMGGNGPMAGGAPMGGNGPMAGGAPMGGNGPMAGGAPMGGNGPMAGGAPMGGNGPMAGGDGTFGGGNGNKKWNGAERRRNRDNADRNNSASSKFGSKTKTADKEEEELHVQLIRVEPIKKYFALTAMEFCRKLDDNSNKRITKDEVEKIAPELMTYFNDWDRGKVGFWTQTDFVIGFCTARNLYNKAQRIFNINGDKHNADGGIASFQKWLDNDPVKTFKSLDLNGDGFVTSKECPPEYAEIFASILKRFDSNSDGKADQKEFCTGIDELRKKINQQMPLRPQRKGRGPEKGQENGKKSEMNIEAAPTVIDNRPSLRSAHGDFVKPEKGAAPVGTGSKISVPVTSPQGIHDKFDTDPKDSAGSPPDTKSTSNSKTQPEAKVNPNIKSQSDAEVKPDAEVKSDAEVKPGAEVKSDPEVKSGAEVKSDAEEKSGAEVKPDADFNKKRTGRLQAGAERKPVVAKFRIVPGPMLKTDESVNSADKK